MRHRPTLGSSFFRAVVPTMIATGTIALTAAPALAKPYTLEELLALAQRTNPGVAAGAHATRRVEAQLSEANRSWLPTGELLSLFAPVPDIHCDAASVSGADGKPVNAKDYCLHTNVTETSTRFSGIFTRTEVHLTQPIFTFGKISAGREAATKGVAASKSQEAGIAADVALNVRRAYYGIKLAKAILETFDEGTEYLDDAQKRIEKQLAEGNGAATPTDRLRLKVVRADIDSRRLEAEKLGGDARAGLRALMGPEAPPDLDVDGEELAAVEVPSLSLTHYQEEARAHRPEVNALNNLVAAKRSLANLERNKQFPDLVLIGSATYARANSIDDPQNAFLNDPFNVTGFGLAAAVRLPLDLGVRNARAEQAAAEADETEMKRRDALAGIGFEVARAYGSLNEAQKRLVAVRTGERAAKAWITAVSQNFAAGLAETKDSQDALVQFFSFRVRVLQAEFDVNIAAATLGRTTGTIVTAGGTKTDDAEKKTPGPTAARESNPKK